MNLNEFRTKYPMYNDMPDEQLADGIHAKFYSDMSREEFLTQIDFTPPIPESGLIDRIKEPIIDWQRERKIDEFRRGPEEPYQAPETPPGYEDVAGMGPPIAEEPEPEDKSQFLENVTQNLKDIGMSLPPAVMWQFLRMPDEERVPALLELGKYVVTRMGYEIIEPYTGVEKYKKFAYEQPISAAIDATIILSLAARGIGLTNARGLRGVLNYKKIRGKIPANILREAQATGDFSKLTPHAMEAFEGLSGAERAKIFRAGEAFEFERKVPRWEAPPTKPTPEPLRPTKPTPEAAKGAPPEVPAVKEPPIAKTLAELREIAEKGLPKLRKVEEFPVRPPKVAAEVAPEKPIILEPEAKPPTKEIEREFAKEVDEVIGDIGPQPGLSLRVKKGPLRKGEGIKFSDPDIEGRYQASKGVGREGIYFKVKNAFTSLKNKATREYEHLPRTEEFAQLRFDLLRLSKQKGVSSDRTLRAIQGITINLNKPAYDLFTRKVILDDLEAVAAKEKALPLGFDKDSLAAEKGRVDAEVSRNPDVSASVDKRKRLWTAIREDYIKAMDAIGFDVSKKLQNENYFRHQVLQYANARGIAGAGKKLRTPTYRGFLKRRRGSQLDINTDYLEAEHEVMAQMLHDIEIARTIRGVEQNYDISDRLKKEAAKKKVPWQTLVPEGYTTWQPREGNVFYMADSIPANIAKEITASALEQVGISGEDLKKILSMGRKRKEMAIKEEIAATLENLMLPSADNVISQANKKALRAWKIWTLISPRRWAKYNTRNATGDADAAYLGNPKGFLQTPRATRELYDIYAGDKAMTPDLKDWFERGGMQSTLQAQEMGELKKLKMFIDKYERRGKITPRGLWQGYWKAARLTTDFRESILRYANYLEYDRQMRKNPQGRPDNFGASIPEEIMGLKDIKDRAFWLQNDLLGAYDRVSVMGHALREHLYPFWSWKEVNFKRYIRLFKNAADDRQLASAIGRKALGTALRTPYTSLRVGRFIIKALAFWGMLQAWNNLMFPEEEESLSDEQRNTPHIIFGRDDQGKVIWFPRVGALGDFLEWFGLDQAPEMMRDWYRGKRSLREIVTNMGKSFVNVVVQGVTPFIKTPFEIITRRSLFPDVFRPGTVRDRGYHIARSLGLENEYKAIMGLPMEPYERSMPKFFVYTVDPFAGAYRDIMAEKSHYMKKIGKYGEGFWINPRGNALYNFKLALRYGDKKAAQIYLKKYIALGGTPEGIEQSLQYLHPLSGLNKYEMVAFVASLKEDDRRKLAKALRFYVDVLLGTKKIQE